ncbi:MAG: sigma-70 family RNA polymerase sigma factor [Pirellulales bacterium]
MQTPPTSVPAAAAVQLEDLLTLYRARLLAMLRRRIDPRLAVHVDPEDLLTNVFLLARRRWNRPQLKGDKFSYSWFYRLALDCLIRAWRYEVQKCRDCRGRLPWPEESSLHIVMGLVDAGSRPSEALLHEENLQAIRVALATLSESDQEILRMRHEDELTHVEAAAVLGITVRAATMRYLRALQRLRDAWKSNFAGDSQEPGPT